MIGFSLGWWTSISTPLCHPPLAIHTNFEKYEGPIPPLYCFESIPSPALVTIVISVIHFIRPSMAKSRFTSTDVRAMVRDLREAIAGQRLVNIYDLHDNKTYIFKFSSK